MNVSLRLLLCVFPIAAFGLYLEIVLIFSAVGIPLTIAILILFHKEGQPKEDSFNIKSTYCVAEMIYWSIPGLQQKSKDTNTRNKIFSMTDTTKLKTRRVESSDFDYDVIMKKDDLDIGSCSIISDDVSFRIAWRNVAEILDRFCFFSFATITFLCILLLWSL